MKENQNKIIFLIGFILKLPQRLFVGMVKIYQATLSPDHGLLKPFFPQGYCRFYPSCSEYAVLVVQKKGFLRGVFLVAWRILRCNPWSRGGLDFPKEKKKKLG